MLSIYASNQTILRLEDLWRPIGVAILGSLVLWAVLRLATRSWLRAAAATSVISLAFLQYDSIASLMPSYFSREVVLGSITIATLGLASLAAWKWRWHQLAGVFSIFLIALPITKIALQEFERRSPLRPAEVGGNGKEPNSKPNIVYVILDGYGRTDVFEERYGFSDRKFIEGLETRGFYVAKEARANYSQTELSVSSSLNLEYVQNIPSIKANPYGDRAFFREAIEDNVAMARLKKLGYRTSAITSGFPSITFPKIELIPREAGELNILESALIERLPFHIKEQLSSSQHLARRDSLLRAFRRLGDVGRRTDSPTVTVVHILAPHPPFDFGPNGELLPSMGPFGYWDGSDFTTHVANKSVYRKGYAGQAEFVGKRILEAIDRILQLPGERPIIIIQGDHGPKSDLDQTDLSKTDVDECFPILNAYLVPDSVKKELYPAITPVNSFRTIFRVLFGDELPNLSDRSWYSPYNHPLDFVEVTDQIGKETLESIALGDLDPILVSADLR